MTLVQCDTMTTKPLLQSLWNYCSPKHHNTHTPMRWLFRLMLCRHHSCVQLWMYSWWNRNSGGRHWHQDSLQCSALSLYPFNARSMTLCCIQRKGQGYKQACMRQVFPHAIDLFCFFVFFIDFSRISHPLMSCHAACNEPVIESTTLDHTEWV